MYCLFLLCASLYTSLPHTCVCQPDSDPLPFERVIQDYFKTDSVRRLKKEWETVRKSYEHALVMFMKERNVGSSGVNMFIKKKRDKTLARGYFHNDNQVRVIFRDLHLEDIPFYLYPDVKLNLASNVLKVYSPLSNMNIHADYVLIRNQSDVIHDPKEQDPYKSSPFLFEQVQDVGKVAITMQECELKGFMSLEVDTEVVTFAHVRFKIFNCAYTIEIYRPGDESPPVIARYNMSDNSHGLDLTDLLKKPLLTNSLVPTLQTALFSFVNTSAIFGYSAIREFAGDQAIVFQLTAKKLTELVRQMNKLTIEKNQGAIEMADYVVHWDDGRIKPSNKNAAGSGESLKLTQMVLTGLDTLYSAHKGGPFEFDTVRIAEKLRFSSIQVRGKLEIISTWSDIFDFAAEISDLTMELHMDLSENKNESKPDTWIKDRKLGVEGMRKMTFTVPTLIFGSAESLIGGYLLKEVPKLINAHSIAIFDQAMQESSKKKPSNPTKLDAGDNKNDVDDLMIETDYEYPDDAIESGTLILNNNYKDPEEIKGIRERDAYKKSKKRFMSLNHPRRWRRGRIGKRVAKNEIRNK